MTYSCIRAQNSQIKSPASEFSHKAENHNDLGIVDLKKIKEKRRKKLCTVLILFFFLHMGFLLK